MRFHFLAFLWRVGEVSGARCPDDGLGRDGQELFRTCPQGNAGGRDQMAKISVTSFVGSAALHFILFLLRAPFAAIAPRRSLSPLDLLPGRTRVEARRPDDGLGRDDPSHDERRRRSHWGETTSATGSATMVTRVRRRGGWRQSWRTDWQDSCRQWRRRCHGPDWCAASADRG